MKTLKALFVIVLSVDNFATAGPIPEHSPHEVSKRRLDQFLDMIVCQIPGSSPIGDYTDYGCYCGYGGKGAPLDHTDRCCHAHDECYVKVQEHSECKGFLGFWFWKKSVPYIRAYDYTCDKDQSRVTCSESNRECEMFLCQCDREAADCFAKHRKEFETNKDKYYDYDSAGCA